MTAAHPGSIPAFKVGDFYPGRVIPVTLKLVSRWLHCHAPGNTGSAHGLVGQASVYCDWAGQHVSYATSISVWQHVHITEQIRPCDTLACCWDVKQATNQQYRTSDHCTCGHSTIVVSVILQLCYPTSFRCAISRVATVLSRSSSYHCAINPTSYLCAIKVFILPKRYQGLHLSKVLSRSSSYQSAIKVYILPLCYQSYILPLCHQSYILPLCYQSYI